jgi:hypothetical protein
MLFPLRRLLFATLGLAALSVMTLLSAAQRTPQPIPSPNAPNQSLPNGMDGPAIKEPNGKAVDKQNQAEVKAEIEKLYALVFELREEMKQTNGNSTLSVTVVKKAQQIEKLARDIKDRAKN